MRVFGSASIGKAPAAEVAWAGAALESIAALKVYEGLPATRARQSDDIVDDVLTRNQHLTRVLVQGGQASKLCPQPVLHLGLQLRLQLRLDCFDPSPQIRFEVVDVQVLCKVAVSKARVALQGKLRAQTQD